MIRRTPRAPLGTRRLLARRRLPSRWCPERSVEGESGSASIWVLAGAVVVLAVALVVMARTTAILARHRAETAADFAALAAASGIGVDATTDQICARARRIALVNTAVVTSCAVTEDVSGRSGTVTVAVTIRVRLVGVGIRTVGANARAGRLPAGET